jgi:dipeptide/tripeptide permease
MSNFTSIFKSFPKTFWIANTIELFERLAWYGFYMLFANYLTGSFDDGGLQFTQSQKGIMSGVGTAIVYFLPVFTGALADKFGYKRMLFISFIVYFSAFMLLPQFTSFAGVFAVYIFLALGAALFKPVISATIAKTTNDKNSSIGFGIFYLMVNMGSFIGPLITLTVKSTNFSYMFYISAAFILLNFLILLFYKEPKREKDHSKDLQAILNDILTVLKDTKFVVFLIIIAGFWAMYFQLFFSLPVYIEYWVNTDFITNLFKDFDFVMKHYTKNGQIEAEFITNFDALFIIIFQVLISYLVMKYEPINAMIFGIVLASFGMALTFLTQNVIFTMVAILIFAFGEMSASPKITEYIGKIAPADKKGLYMGYSFIPVFIGSFIAGIISGPVFGELSDKHVLLNRYLLERNVFVEQGNNLNATFRNAAQELGLSETALRDVLWIEYSPANFWVVVLSIGLFASIALAVYNRYLNKL